MIYNDWREEAGLLFLKTLIPLASFISIFTYSMFQDISASLLTILMIFLALHVIRLGELDIIINNESLPLVGNKGTMRRFWDQLESSLSIIDKINHENVGTEIH